MKKIKGFYKEEDGVVLILVSFLVVILLSFSAFAIDLGVYNLKKGQLQTACDAAALAGCYKLPDTAQAIITAKEYLVKNGFSSTAAVVTIENYNKSVKVVSAQDQTTYFANIFGVKHLGYSCLATATTTTKKIAGAAMGFAIYSGNSYPTQPSFSVRLQNVCTLTGLSNVVNGSVHANYNVDANTSFIVGTGEAVGTVTGTNIQEKVSGAANVPMPDFSIYKPIIKAEAQAVSGHYYSGNFSIANASSVNLNSPVYVEGSANLSGISFYGAGCLYAGGKISIKGSNTNYDSTSKICLYSGYTSTSKSDAAIDFSGSSKNFTGMLYAPNGSILVSGSNYTFSGNIIGRVVDISGSNKTFQSQDISDSFHYATTSAIVLTQ